MNAEKTQWKQKQIELNSDMKLRECVLYRLDFNLKKKKLWWRWRRDPEFKKRKKKNNDNKSNSNDSVVDDRGDEKKNDLRNMV